MSSEFISTTYTPPGQMQQLPRATCQRPARMAFGKPRGAIQVLPPIVIGEARSQRAPTDEDSTHSSAQDMLEAIEESAVVERLQRMDSHAVVPGQAAASTDVFQPALGVTAAPVVSATRTDLPAGTWTITVPAASNASTDMPAATIASAEPVQIPLAVTMGDGISALPIQPPIGAPAATTGD
eukprot:4597686-Amphidinium_carterae.1